MISWNAGTIFALDASRRSAHPPDKSYLAPFLVHSRGSTINTLPRYFYLDTKDLQQSLVDHRPPGSWVLLLPYWIILLALLISWSLLLLWRARRLKRDSLVPP
jgi:hypothetical protein